MYVLVQKITCCLSDTAWADADVLSIRPIGTYFTEIFCDSKSFHSNQWNHEKQPIPWNDYKTKLNSKSFKKLRFLTRNYDKNAGTYLMSSHVLLGHLKKKHISDVKWYINMAKYDSLVYSWGPWKTNTYLALNDIINMTKYDLSCIPGAPERQTHISDVKWYH